MEQTQILRDKIEDADLVLIGIGEEMSENFEQIGIFPELMEALNRTEEDSSLDWTIPFIEKAYIEKQEVNENVLAYQKLYELVKDKNYFVVSTCIDGLIEKAGFNIEKIVQPCGNYNQMQCSDGCTKEVFSSSDYYSQVMSGILTGKAEAPLCPHCGKELVFNQVIYPNYVENGYLSQWEKYTKWLSCTLNKKLCIIELGVGKSFTTVIKSPFEKVGFFNLKASFFRINGSDASIPEDMGEKGVGIPMNAKDFLNTEL